MRAVLFTPVICLLLLGSALGGCRRGIDPADVTSAADDGSQGVYYAAPNKIFEREQPFDIRWKVTHAPQVKTFDPAINVDNRTLAFNRCTNCHKTCGFERAFDFANYGKPNWEPQIKGQDWAAPAIRMIPKNNSFLNDAIVERIYTFLRDETTVGYDESKDPKGAVTVETEADGSPVKYERAKTPQPGHKDK
jgi:hypothetical protein